MIYIIIPVHNRLNLTKKCLDSLYKQSFNDWSVYIVDDGSTDGTKEYLNSLKNPKIHYIEGDGFLWWTGAIKLGISKVLEIANKSDFIMTVNNDIVFDENAINALINNMKNDNQICSSLSVASNSLPIPFPDFTGGIWKNKNKLEIMREINTLDNKK